VPAAGTYRDFVRLYPRGVGETVVLSSGEIPLVAAWRPGGKVVSSATTDVDVPALVRAVLKDTGGIRLRAWREGDAAVAEATSSGGAPFLFGDVSVTARPVAPDRWRATLQNASRSLGEVSCGPATAIVPLGGPLGLGNRKDIAAAIATSSGGLLLQEVGGDGRRVVPAWVTILLAAGLVVVSAWRRRRT
jgi:hypothetical protein